VGLAGGVGSVVAFRDSTLVRAEQERLRGQVGDLEWLEEVRQAIEEDRLVLFGQPIVDVATGTVVRHELLLRLVSSTGQVITPDRFLPAAERFGLIDAIDRWVVTRALEQAADRRAVSVNLAGSSVGRVGVLRHIERELDRTGAPPYGSLTYLRELPIAHIKVGGDVVRGMAHSVSDRMLVRTVVELAHDLGKEIIAEGVEDQETFDLLRDLGVDFVQGFFIGPPEELF
jgi:EAL domain-containing protein (putative c-di-GMP-specific phosphodiesterase class I)